MNKNSMNHDPVQELLGRLKGVKRTGPDKWEARCPAHDDRKPSLSVSQGDDGKALVHCHVGCSLADVLQAIGLTERDLFPQSGEPSLDAGEQRRIVRPYDYRDANRELLFQVVRYEPKDFRQRRPDGTGGWIWNLKGVPRVLYGLPDIHGADEDKWVFVVEGEKDADNVAALGLVATTCPGGAGKWGLLSDDAALHGRRLAIIPDKDEPGRKHAEDVAQRLCGKAAEVRILELPGEAKDVSDWLELLDSKEPGDLAGALVKMAEAAPVWTPETRHANSGPIPVLVCLADVEPEQVQWLWPKRIPLGKLTLLVGDPNLGKSLITLDMAARVSMGRGWPDAVSTEDSHGGVVLLTAEDDLADTVRPRLDAAGAEVSRIRALESVKRRNVETGDARQTPFNLKADLPALEEAVRSTPQCRLVVIDPISAYLSGTDSHKNTDMRGVLAPLAELAARHKVAVVCVTHLRKGDGPAMYRTMGSLAFVAAARSAYVVMPDRDDPQDERRLMLPLKNNLASDRTGLAYALHCPPDGGGLPVLRWEPDPITVTVEEVLGHTGAREDGRGAQRLEAMAWLKEALKGGPAKARDLVSHAKAEGISDRTLHRAKQSLGIRACRKGYGPGGTWVWELPE